MSTAPTSTGPISTAQISTGPISTGPFSTGPSAPSASPPAPTTGPADGAVPDHVRLGVGLRFTLLPAADDVVPAVLGSLAAGSAAVPAVTVRTDDVSSLVRGSEQDLARYLVAVLVHAAHVTASGHVVATVHLSRGCPGEVGCAVDGGLPAVEPVRLEPTGVAAAAHWALYPLGTTDAMGPIERAVATARSAGVATPEHFVTRLEGDLADVVAQVVDTWTATGREVAHVVTHATISLGSPTATGGAR